MYAINDKFLPSIVHKVLSVVQSPVSSVFQFVAWNLRANQVDLLVDEAFGFTTTPCHSHPCRPGAHSAF